MPTTLQSTPRFHVRRLRQKLRNLGTSFYCPCCRSHLKKFSSHGVPVRPHARCPVCRALDRQRLSWLYLQRETPLLKSGNRRLLHVAPEPEFSRLLQAARTIEYFSTDIESPLAMIHTDLMNPAFEDNTFDILYCSHVLEHVPNDLQVMREFRRVLKPDGWAIIMVPIDAEETFEDPSVVTPEEREKVFGQHDHCRRYGPDIQNRLEEAGFEVTAERYASRLDPAVVRKCGLLPDEIIFVCRPAA